MKYYEGFELNEAKESRAFTVTKQALMEFAGEWDPQPFHIDEKKAEQWPMGLIASSIHTYAISMKLCVELATEPVATIAGLGVDEMRMTAPVKAGDQLRVRVWAESKRESRSNPACGIVRSKIQVLNQHDDVVMSYLNTGLVRKETGVMTPA